MNINNNNNRPGGRREFDWGDLIIWGLCLFYLVRGTVVVGTPLLEGISNKDDACRRNYTASLGQKFGCWIMKH